MGGGKRMEMGDEVIEGLGVRKWVDIEEMRLMDTLSTRRVKDLEWRLVWMILSLSLINERYQYPAEFDDRLL